MEKKEQTEKTGKEKFKSYSEMIDFLADKKKKDGKLNKLGEWLLSHGKNHDFWVTEDMKAVMK